MRRPSSQGIARGVVSESARSPDGFNRGRKFLGQRRSKSRDAHLPQEALPAPYSPSGRVAHPSDGERRGKSNNSTTQMQSEANYYYHGNSVTGIGYGSPASMREVEPMGNIPRVTAMYSPRSPRYGDDKSQDDANYSVQLTPRSEDDAFLHSPRSPFSSANTTPRTTPR
jgi:hypothetical protein